MALSRKYYELVAKEINEMVKLQEGQQSALFTLDKLMCNLALRFEEDNANFDNVKFLKACLKDVT
tara:strand:- start:2013 stop:2207 length:195 start_codon:yes stop_codon:yes gene_type:complete